jgi:hypothetical protein
MEEVAKIATSLIAIDAKLKSTETALSTHKHKFADLLEKPTTLGGYGITDGMTATAVAAAIQQAISDLVNGSGAALDTLKELADALGNDPEFATTVGKALGLRVRVDDAQSFTLAQKKQGRANLDALGTVDKGKADGVASLDGSGKVPSSQLPAMDYLPLGGGTLTGPLILRAPGNKVLRFVREDGTRAAAIYANADGSPGFNIAVDDASGGGTKTFVFDVSGGLSVPASLAVAANIYIGASGQIASDGNIKGTRWGAGGGWLFDYLNSDNTRLGAFAFPRRSDGLAVQFQWSGQSGQPTWLWGGTGTDGDNGIYRVWNPANFNVNYANGAGNIGGWDINGILNRIEDRAYAHALSQVRELCYAARLSLMWCRPGGQINPNDLIAGANLRYAGLAAGGSNYDRVTVQSTYAADGTWRMLGFCGVNPFPQGNYGNLILCAKVI